MVDRAFLGGFLLNQVKIAHPQVSTLHKKYIFLKFTGFDLILFDWLTLVVYLCCQNNHFQQKVSKTPLKPDN